MLGASVLRAHEGHAHKLVGTVTAVHAEMNHVELKTKDGKAAAFYVTAETKYLKGSAPAALSALVAGTRVVVTTRMEGDKSIATEVKMGGTTTTKAPAAKPSLHHE
jgi:pyrimidine deaminase RibD-like protein